MVRKYGIKGKMNAFIKNKEDWKTIVPDISNAVLKNLKQQGLESPSIFLNMQPSTALKVLSEVPKLKKRKSTFLFYKKILDGLSKYRRWLSTIIYNETNFYDINMDVLKFIVEGTSTTKTKGFYTPKSLLILVMEKDSILTRTINVELISKVKECLLNHCNKKFGKIKFTDKFIKKICEIAFEINDKIENTPLITKTIATIGADKIEPFFSKIPNNFLIFMKKLKLPFNFNGIFKEFVNQPLILRTILNETQNSKMKNIITSFFEKIQAFILGKETLSNAKEQSKINFFQSFENNNNKIHLEFKEKLERYYIYLNKISLYFFNEINEINKINLFQKIYICLFFIQNCFYCLNSRAGITRLKNKLTKLVRIFKINDSSYQNFFLTKKFHTNFEYEKIQQELKEFLSRLLMFVLLEPLSLSSKILNPNSNFLSILKLEDTQIDFLNCLGIFTILVPHPILELQKQSKSPSSLGSNPNSKSIKIALRGMNPVALIKIKNPFYSYQNYFWFCLSIYEAVLSINESLNTYYSNKFNDNGVYKIILHFDGIMFKYEDVISAASQIDFNLNLKFIKNSYEISDPNLEIDYLSQIKKPLNNNKSNDDKSNDFINRLTYLLNEKYKSIAIDKNNSEVILNSPQTGQTQEKYNSKIDEKDEEFKKMIDLWDYTWQMNSEYAAIIYIINQIDVTIYEVNFPYKTTEVFFPLTNFSYSNDIDQKLPSVILAQNLSKIQNTIN